MDIDQLIETKKELLREQRLISNPIERVKFGDRIIEIDLKIDQARRNGTATNDVNNTKDCYGLMAK